MAKFPASCTDCGFEFDTTVDLPQEDIDAHLAAHALGKIEIKAFEDAAKAIKEANEADEARRLEIANNPAPDIAPDTQTLVV
jgi:hypothetical protein